jgi:MOSC domain-containing protein YiiM
MSDGKYLIKGLFLGTKETLPNGQESAIRKKSVESIKINFTHISHDAIVDQVHHGGEMRVIHHYSEHNYKIHIKHFSDIYNIFRT